MIRRADHPGQDSTMAEPPRRPRDMTLLVCTGILLLAAAGLLAMCNALSQL